MPNSASLKVSSNKDITLITFFFNQYLSIKRITRLDQLVSLSFMEKSIPVYSLTRILNLFKWE
nr:MAG TPA: hypothetical protein [Caudoviricetes sp.]